MNGFSYDPKRINASLKLNSERTESALKAFFEGKSTNGSLATVKDA